MDLIVRKHAYKCCCIFTAQLITYCTVHVGVRTCTLYRVYIYGREYRMRRNRNGRNVLLRPEAVDMNGRFQMQGGKNWILPK